MLPTNIQNLSDFFATIHFLSERNLWFRGHSRIDFRLTPSALRYTSDLDRRRALNLLPDMKRVMEIKLSRPPAPNDQLGWVQVAQHHGLPTRLLDWTHNAAVALFFACSEHSDKDGLVVAMNPVELNQRVVPKEPRVLNPDRDLSIINRYFKLGEVETPASGPRTVALNPTWNNERIALQQGAFTLHGARRFELDSDQCSTLMYVPILRENKAAILGELDRFGIGEMFIFPEPEHVCRHLKRRAGL